MQAAVGAGPGAVVVVVDRVDDYQIRLARGVRDEAKRHDLPVLVHVTDPLTPTPPPTLAGLLRRGAARGVILTSTRDEQSIDAIRTLVRDLDVPNVGLSVDAPSGARVTGGNRAGMALIMAHLLDERGVRRPALLRGLRHHPDSRAREAAFRAEMAARALPVDEGLVVDGNFNQDAAYWATTELLTRRRDMDAIVALNDLSALGVLSALEDAGLSVPGDVLVTGFDNERAASRAWPGLTTVDHAIEEHGARAVRVLLSAAAGRAPASGDLDPVPPRLVVRASTGAPASAPEVTAALEMARDAHTEVATLDAVLELNRAMMTCRTLAQIVDVLAPRLTRLGLGRCFLALFDEADAGNPADPLARLVFAHGVPEGATATGATFPCSQLLPAGLQPELARGVLIVQPLSVADDHLGFVVFEQVKDMAPASEVLRMDLSRTLQTVATARELADRAAHLERLVTRRTRELEAEVATRRRAENELHHANRTLQGLLRLDGLTRIANRAAFETHLGTQWRRLADESEPGGSLALLMVDVDLFKAYNDRYGHLLGDDALRTVAACLQQSVRGADDLACRYGGEEFAVVLPCADAAGALGVARRFRALLVHAAIPHDASTVAPVVTASVGIAVAPPTRGGDPYELVQAADAALYRAKDLGRDQIVVADLADAGAEPGHALRPAATGVRLPSAP